MANRNARQILNDLQRQAEPREQRKRTFDLDDCMPSIPDKRYAVRPVAESNEPGARFVRNFERLKT